LGSQPADFFKRFEEEGVTIDLIINSIASLLDLDNAQRGEVLKLPLRSSEGEASPIHDLSLIKGLPFKGVKNPAHRAGL